MHQAIILDLGKVIVPFDFSRGYQALEAVCPYPAQEIRRRMAATRLVAEFECGRVDPRDFVGRMTQTLAANLDYDSFCAMWSSIFLPPQLEESLLEGLAARYRLVLLSNTNHIHFEMLRAAHVFFRHFHHLVLSYKVGALKPDPTIYQAALDCAGCAAEQCFYTDDIPAFVEGGRAAGMDAVLFESPEQLKRELRGRGIRWE